MSADTTPAARREVRKVVTIVFVDLAGSTSLQEHMDPESARRVMERFYATMRAEIEGAGGLVVKFTGDGVMAGFGIREAREDDALCAVRAAASIQQSFGRFADEIRRTRGADVYLRVGINTGEVVVSDEDDDVVGDVVNVAARLEHAAGEGNILVGGETWRLTRHAVTFETVAPLELKGKAEPVPAYRLVSLEAPSDQDGTAAPFVGRRVELDRLREVFDRASADAVPAVITIVGSPGLGKTRIAIEFVSSVAGRARVLEAKCDPAGTSTYAPLAEALREAAGIPETASADEVVASLERLLAKDFPDRIRVAKHAASLLGVGDSVAPQETFWAVRRLLEGIASTGPVVLVVDDVQWAEPMLLDLLDHIVEWARDAAILIVALARPEIRDVRPSLVDAGSIVLEGLDPDDTAALALSLLGAHDLPAELVRRILATTEGNPLFVRELLRMLVDDGVLSREGDRWVVTVEAEEIDVPPTIHALLSARLDRLREEERAVVERASVVGKEFYRGAVMELVSPTVRSGIDVHLETLRRKELVEPEGTYWIDERVFRFHHVLIRDAAYRRLLKEVRAELHERFADWLEAKVGQLIGEHEEVLGYHLEQAHTYLNELDGPDDHCRDLGRRAAAHLTSAARRALDRDDLASAANLSGRALVLTDDDEARARILLDRCEALLGMGEIGAAAEAVGGLRRTASDERLQAWADCFDGQLAILTDPARLRETAEVVEDAARRLEALQDKAGAAKAHAVHAQALAHLGQFGACEAALDRALAAAREAGDRRRANAVLASAPLAALWGPNPVPRASGRCLDVVRVLRITAGAPAVEATALRCQAVLEAMRGRADAAHRMLASARKTLQELGLRHALVECDLFGGLIDLLSRDFEGAEAKLREAYDGFRRLNVGTDVAQSAALLARALVEVDRDDEALALTDESERLGGDDLKTAIAWRCVRARVLARRSELDDAITLAREAVAIAEATDALVDHADARLALAEVLTAAGRGDEAHTETHAGAELYARKEATAASVEGPASQSAKDETPRSVEPHDDGVTVRAAPGVHAPEAVASADRLIRALRAGDWDGMAALLTEDHVYVDHRSGLRSEQVGRDGFIEFSRSLTRNMESIAGVADWQRPTWDVETRARWSDDLTLSRVRHRADGWDKQLLSVNARRDGKLCRKEEFDPDDHVAALIRLDELSYDLSPARPAIERYVSGPNKHGWREVVGIAASGNAAVVRANKSFAVVFTDGGQVIEVEVFDDELGARRSLHELAPSPSYVNWFLRHQFERHANEDWAALRSLMAPDVVIVDHGPVAFGTLRGIDQVLAFLQESHSTMTESLSIADWLAITENRALYRYRWVGRSPDGADFEVDRLMVTELREGVTARGDIFELDQINEARRLMASATFPVGPAFAGYADVFNARAWDRADEVFAPGYFLIDHRLAGFGKRDLATFVETMKTMVELAPDVQVYPEPILTTASAEVCHLHLRGHTKEGGEFLLEIGAALRVLDGKALSGITFDRVDAEAATRWASDHSIGYGKEDFDVLRRQTSAAHPVVSAVQRIVELGHAGDWTGVSDAIAEDVLYEDHRPLMRTASRGRDVLLEAVRYQLRDGGRLDVEVVDDRGPRLALVRVLKRLGASGESEIPLLIVYGIDFDGRLSHALLFSESDVDAARARVDAIAQRAPAPSPLFVEFGRQWEKAFRTGAGAELEALYTADFKVVEHPNHMELDLQTHLESMQRVAAQPNATARVEAVLCLGQRHGVSRTTFSFDHSEGLAGPSEIVGVSAVRLDPEGRCPLFEWFLPDKLHRALARAEELYIEDEATGEAAAGARRRRAVWLSFDAQNEDRWDDFADALAPDVVLLDRRPIGWGRIEGRQAFVDAVRAIKARSVRHVWSVTEVHAISDRGCVYTMPVTGVDREGGSYEQGGVCVSLAKDEGLRHAEVFPFDALDEALARFEELQREAEPPATVAEWFARVEATLARGDLKGYGALWTEDVVIEERRPLLRSTTTGRQAAVDSLLHVKDLAAMRLETEVIATRGDRLELRLVRYLGEDVDGGAFDVPILQLHEMNAAGLVCRAVLFEPDDLAAALDELDQRLLMTLPSARARLYRAMVSLRTIYDDRDWDAWRAVFHPEVTVVDHRPVGWGTFTGADRLVSVMRGLVDLIPDVRVVTTSLERLTGEVCLNGARVTGTDANRAAVELAYYLLFEYRDGKVVRYELFPIEQRDTALARADELSEDPGEQTGDNEQLLPDTTIERTWDRLIDALNARDFDAVGDLYASDYVQREHLFHLEMGREGQLANAKKSLVGSTSVRRERSLVFGDRHALVKMIWSVGSGRTLGESEIPQWVSTRCDGEGRLVHAEVYGAESDLLRALERTEELCLEDEARDEDAVAGRRRLLLWRYLHAYNADDWDAVREILTPDMVTIDHRPSGWGRIEGRNAWLDTIRGLAGVAPDRRWALKAVEFDGDVVLLELDVVGTSEDDGSFVLPWLAVVVMGDAGLLRQDLFSPEQRDQARALYHSLVQADPPGWEPPPATVGEWYERYSATLLSGDLEASASMFTEDVVMEERRPSLRSVATGRTALIDTFAHVKDLRTMHMSSEVVETRGDYLELRWIRYVGEDTDGGEFDVPILAVNEMNEQGLVSRAVLFEPEDLESALEEIEERYIASLPPRQAEIARATRWVGVVYRAHDWDAYQNLFHDDLLVIDHRPAGWGTLHGSTELMTLIRGLAELVPDLSVIGTAVDQINDHFALIPVRVTGTDQEGGLVEFPMLTLFGYRDGKFDRYEMFPTEDRAEAVARFHELTAKADSSQQTPTILEAWDGFLAALNQRDFAEVERQHAPGVRVRDHTYHLELGVQEQMANLRQTLTGRTGVRRGRTFVLGDRHGVVEMIWSADSGPTIGDSEVAIWSVNRCDADGRFHVTDLYSVGDLVRALERAEEIYLEDEATGAEAEASRHRLTLWRAFIADNEGDWDRWRSLIGPDIVVVDHRPLGWGLGDSDGVRRRQQALRGLTDDNRIRVESVVIDGDVFMVEFVSEGTSKDGAKFEMPGLSIQVGDKRQELFVPEQREEAERRFREFAAEARLDGNRHEAP